MSAALFSMMPTTRPSPVPEPTVAGQLAAFLVIGAAGAGAFVGLSGLMTQMMGTQSWLINALCYAVLIGPVYLAHRRFSFQSELPHWHALPRYICVQVMAVGLVSLFSFLVYSLFAMQSVAAATLVIGLTASFNFMVLRSWAFARSRSPLVPRLSPARPLTHE